MLEHSMRSLGAALGIWLLGAIPALAQPAPEQDAGSPTEASADGAGADGAGGEGSGGEETGGEEAGAEGAAGPAADAGEAAETPAAEERPQTLEPPPPAPLMVVVVGERRVPAETSQALAAALAEALDAPAGRREVHALGNEAILVRVAECEDDACYGAILAEAQAAGGVFARVSRRGRRYPVTVEVRDPVSGALRGEAVEGELARDAEPAEAVASMLESLVAALPDPPPPDPTLLVTVNVDGAEVRIDDIAIGTSPVAPVTVASGFHDIAVTAPGYASVRRQTQVAPGDTGRVDVTLRPLSPDQAAQTAQTTPAPASGGAFEEELTDQWWFWTLIGGGAVLVIGAAIVIGMVATQGDDTRNDLPTGVPLPGIVGGMF